MAEPIASRFSPETHALFDQIQMLAAGHRTEDVLLALVYSLAMTVGFASDTRKAANQLLKGLTSDMQRTIGTNWDYLRSLRAQPQHEQMPRA